MQGLIVHSSPGKRELGVGRAFRAHGHREARPASGGENVIDGDEPGDIYEPGDKRQCQCGDGFRVLVRFCPDFGFKECAI